MSCIAVLRLILHACIVSGYTERIGTPILHGLQLSDRLGHSLRTLLFYGPEYCLGGETMTIDGTKFTASSRRRAPASKKRSWSCFACAINVNMWRRVFLPRAVDSATIAPVVATSGGAWRLSRSLNELPHKNGQDELKQRSVEGLFVASSHYDHASRRRQRGGPLHAVQSLWRHSGSCGGVTGASHSVMLRQRLFSPRRHIHTASLRITVTNLTH